MFTLKRVFTISGKFDWAEAKLGALKNVEYIQEQILAGVDYVKLQVKQMTASKWTQWLAFTLAEIRADLLFIYSIELLFQPFKHLFKSQVSNKLIIILLVCVEAPCILCCPRGSQPPEKSLITCNPIQYNANADSAFQSDKAVSIWEPGQHTNEFQEL